MGEDRFRAGFDDYQAMNQQQLFEELRTFINALELKDTTFRSDHASNYLPLKGQLGRDKQGLLAQLDTAINTPDKIHLREECSVVYKNLIDRGQARCQ